MFTVPALVIYTIFWIFPIILSAGISFTDWTGMTKLSEAGFVGLKNYANLFQDSILKIAVKNNLIYGIILLAAVPVLAFFIAYLIETFIRRKMFWRTVAYLPAILPVIVTVLLWKWIYNPQYGLLNKLLELVGLEEWTTGWLTNTGTALFAVTFTSLWKTVPTYFVLFLAGLQSVSRDLMEAAVLDGAGRLALIRYVTLPGIKRITVIVYVLVFIDIFRVFDLVYAMTNGGPGYYNTEMILTYGYKTAFTNSNAGYGMAMTTVLLLFVILCSGVQMKIQGKSYD
ncbi:MAG TPA: sugar ABC transporter permease [Candidatus Limivivens intestinipullorum]|uniref:Sugar ABC transporter permease n=1 Tax=Candidatus Limivivens intestinipullorum TaxID=2840858 RepID=A0A9D1JII3_9FIRM|nr:sugar ABC transporter permease [Candidatus Limivivens intestinipullorum]